MKELDIFEMYFYKPISNKSCIFDNVYISSNQDTVFFMAKSFFKDTILALFSKKYYLTLEICDIRKNLKQLNKIANIIDSYRTKKDIFIHKFEFWLPSCLVKNKKIDAQFIAESHGINRGMALDYLCLNDIGFKKIYNRETQTYMGLPLFNTIEEAENYPTLENTENYFNGLLEIEKIKKGVVPHA